jgi:hypothetical protein
MNSTIIHTPKRTIAARARQLRTLDVEVRKWATQDGWAYATEKTTLGRRVVISSAGPQMAGRGPQVGSTYAAVVGELHCDLETYDTVLDWARRGRL